MTADLENLTTRIQDSLRSVLSPDVQMILTQDRKYMLQVSLGDFHSREDVSEDVREMIFCGGVSGHWLEKTVSRQLLKIAEFIVEESRK